MDKRSKVTAISLSVPEMQILDDAATRLGVSRSRLVGMLAQLVASGEVTLVPAEVVPRVVKAGRLVVQK